MKSKVIEYIKESIQSEDGVLAVQVLVDGTWYTIDSYGITIYNKEPVFYVWFTAYSKKIHEFAISVVEDVRLEKL